MRSLVVLAIFLGAMHSVGGGHLNIANSASTQAGKIPHKPIAIEPGRCAELKLAQGGTCQKVGGTPYAPVCAGTCGTCDMTYEGKRAVCKCL